MPKQISPHRFWGREVQPAVQETVYEKQIALDVAVNQQSLILARSSKFQATARPEVKPKTREGHQRRT